MGSPDSGKREEGSGERREWLRMEIFHTNYRELTMNYQTTGTTTVSLVWDKIEKKYLISQSCTYWCRKALNQCIIHNA